MAVARKDERGAETDVGHYNNQLFDFQCANGDS